MLKQPGKTRVDAVVVGASAGAIDALSVILPALPASFAVPVIIVVHVPQNRASLLVDLFTPKCQLPVREAEDKLAAAPGTIWFAPPGYHLLVEREHTFALSVDELVNHSRPSIDVLFESAADAYGERLLTLVLTGANHDGAVGAARIQKAGGLVAVQDPKTAHMASMPEGAIARTKPDLIGSLPELAAYMVTQGTEVRT
ncbi:MAG TPA: chemotaxis protein CheB [Polyangiales bacterium]|nr:chemotaxis protein CheB [Polyangiales bacterium]